jgi:hypothetical protein
MHAAQYLLLDVGQNARVDYCMHELNRNDGGQV